MVNVTHHKNNDISFSSPLISEILSLNEYYNNAHTIQFNTKYSKYFIRVSK